MSQNLLSIYAKSFNWAGFFLPKKTYRQCSDLYDFCRTLDDIADKNQDLQIKRKLFNDFKQDFINKNLNNKNINKIYELSNNFNISSKIILDLFDGVESDLKDSVKLKTNNELIIYSYQVAGTVGLMMAKILNVKSKNSLRSAIDLGIAMQLTNIARDVIEDSNRNRKYINLDFDTIRKTLKLADIFYESSFNPSISRSCVCIGLFGSCKLSQHYATTFKQLSSSICFIFANVFLARSTLSICNSANSLIDKLHRNLLISICVRLINLQFNILCVIQKLK